LTNDKCSNIIRSNIEIFTIKEYMLYKKKYETKDIQDIQLNDQEEEYQYINNSHDKIFRKSLENKKDAIRVINSFLKLESQIKEEDIEKYNSSYITDKLKNSEADIVYKIKDKDIFFLIEHQSKIDYSMAYRILKYEISIIDSVLIETKEKYKNKNYRYPVVIPIVLYTGAQEWNAELNFKNIQSEFKNFEGIELARYSIFDINKLDNKELLKEENIISKLIVLEKSKTREQFIENVEKISNELNKKCYTKDERRICKIATKAILETGFKELDTEEILSKFDKEENDNMLQCAEMLQREIRREKKEAREAGKLEGKLEGKIDIIRNMLKEKLSMNIITTVSGMNEQEIQKIAKEMKVM
jgi:predicted transposase/invertase (TIGR01784 family)